MPDSAVTTVFPVYPGSNVGKETVEDFLEKLEIYIDSHPDFEALDRKDLPPSILGWQIVDIGTCGYTRRELPVRTRQCVRQHTDTARHPHHRETRAEKFSQVA